MDDQVINNILTISNIIVKLIYKMSNKTFLYFELRFL